MWLTRRLKARSSPSFARLHRWDSLPKKSVVNAGILPRVLCLYRFLNPDAEIRVAAGQESSSRPQVMALYRGTPFSWMVIEYGRFLAGPNVQMIKDAGFTIKSEQNLEKLLMEAHRPVAIKKSMVRPYREEPSPLTTQSRT